MTSNLFMNTMHMACQLYFTSGFSCCRNSRKHNEIYIIFSLFYFIPINFHSTVLKQFVEMNRPITIEGKLFGSICGIASLWLSRNNSQLTFYIVEIQQNTMKVTFFFAYITVIHFHRETIENKFLYFVIF